MAADAQKVTAGTDICSRSLKQMRTSSNISHTWAQLQNTLEEVEQSAGTTANVFGAHHSRALEELRRAQIELAKAWARGEEGEGDGGCEDAIGDTSDSPSNLEGSHTSVREASAVLASDRGKLMNKKASISGDVEASKESLLKDKKSQLEQETENDILLARKRRMANDRYFERVNKGVVDVVSRLEIVASKMGGVEMESQEIWESRPR